MKISIVTPVYNDVRVGRALDSILAQRLDHEVETVVVDGGSTDGTIKTLERYRDRISVLICERDRGIFDAMNKGVKRATGDIIGILNADDRYSDENVLYDVMEAFHRQDTGACYGNLVYVNGKKSRVRYSKPGENRRFKWYLGWMPPHPTFFARRGVYERHGFFDTEFRIAGDYELMLRFLFKGRVKSAYIDRPLVYMATGGAANRSFRSVVKANLEVSRAWRKNRLHGGALAPFAKPASKVMQYARAKFIPASGSLMLRSSE